MDYGPELHTYEGKTVGVYGGKFYPFHKGHVACALKAQSQVDILYVIVQYDEEYEQNELSTPTFTHVPHQVRERWITETFKNFPNIRVLSYYEHRSKNYMNDPTLTETYNALDKRLGGIDKFFTNNAAYTPYFKKYLPNTEHVVLFNSVNPVNVDATRIRKNMPAHWNDMPAIVQTWYTPRIALCGIESVGKTHLSNMLATHYQTVNVPEYGRIYYENINGFHDINFPSDYDDIVGGQIHTLNLAHPKANRVLIADTDLIYTQYFHIRQHGFRNAIVEAAIVNNSEHLTHRLFITPRNFFELDGTRQVTSDKQREKDNQQLLNLYAEYGAEVTIIDEPDRAERFIKLTAAVDAILS